MENAEIAGTAQSETGGAGNGNHGAAHSGKEDRGDPEMAQSREENFHRVFESLQLHPPSRRKVFQDIRHRSDPSLHAPETGDPGRSPANPPYADAQGERCSDPEINPEAKTNRTHSDTDRETRPSQLSRNPAGRPSWNQTAKETRHNRQQRTGTIRRRIEKRKSLTRNEGNDF